MAMRIAVGQFKELTDEMLRFAAQIGVGGIQMNNPTLPGETRWEEADIRALVEKTEAAGLVFEAIENVPVTQNAWPTMKATFWFSKTMPNNTAITPKQMVAIRDARISFFSSRSPLSTRVAYKS
jgi:hypothetical protein